MNILKSWGQSFSFFKPSFFKESFGVIRGFIPDFFALVLVSIFFSFLIISIIFFSETLKFISHDKSIYLDSIFKQYGIFIINGFIEFAAIYFVCSKYIKKDDRKTKFSNYLLVFIVWITSVYLINAGIDYLGKVIYSSVSIESLGFLDFSFWASLIKSIFLFSPLTVFFAFELLRPTGSVKNIFKPFLSYPFFLVYNFILFFQRIPIYLKISEIKIIPIYILVVSILFYVFLYIFYHLVTYNVYIKLFKKEESSF